MHVLVSMSGLPGVGKSFIARAVARNLRMCLLELDRIEEPLLRQGIRGDALGWATYEALTALAEQQLSNGVGVILDAVSWTNRLRREWADMAHHAGAPYRPIEVLCSDEQVWRKRVEQRHREAPSNPTWDQVQHARDTYWDPWGESDRLVLDTSNAESDQISQAISYVLAVP